MPDPLELPRMLGAVVPLVRARDAVVNEFVTFTHRHTLRTCCRPATRRVPGFAAVVGTLNDLSEPRAGLRLVQPVLINRRTFHVINLPARKMRAVNLPVFPLLVRCQDERALPCANQ